ncbi:MAG: hypothetical protein ACFE9R_07415 [Candidatus Hermodarchaeota archaeon]
MNNEINKGFYREANLVYLLLKHFSQIRINDTYMYVPKRVSTSNLDSYPFYTNEEGELTDNGLTEWKEKIQELFKPNDGIDFNTNSTFDIEISYSKGIVKSAAKRHFYIEAKGDYINNGKPAGIKSKIQTGLGQLILAATQMDNGIKVGSNLCLAIPFHWEKTLRSYIDGNKLFKKIMQVFGRENTNEGLDLVYFRFLLVNKPSNSNKDWVKVLYLPKNKKNLEESQILTFEEA